MNDSKVIQQTSIQRNPKRVPGQGNNSSLAQETLAGSAKQNITNKKEKSSRAVDTRSMVVSNIKNKNSTTKRSEHIPDTNSSLDSRHNEKKALKNYVGDVGKIEETNLSHTEHEVTQHAGDNNSKINQTEVNTNGDQIPNYNVSNSVTQSQSGVAHVLEETNKQVPVGHSKQSTEQFIENDKNSRTNTESRNNETSSTSVNNVTQEMVSKRSNVAGNKTGKTRMLETLKINFLRKNRTSHWNQNTTSSSEENALETQRNVKLDNETNSKADSDKVASSKSSPAGGNVKKRASVLDKKNSNLHKLDVVSNGANSQQTIKGDEEMSNAKGTDHGTTTSVRTTTSTKAEKIIVNLTGKEEKSKQNKMSITTTSENHKEVDKDTHQKNLNGKALKSTFPKNTQMAKKDLDASSILKKIESSIVYSKEQKMNTSSSNIFHERAGPTTSSVTATNVQEERKHLKPLQNDPGETLKNAGALDSSKANKTIPKENTQVTKKDIIPSDIDSESSQNHNAGSEGDERSDIESERMRNALDEISKQPVDKMMDKVNTKQPVKGLRNSRNDLPNKKRLENVKILPTNTLERLNHSQGATINGEGFKKGKEDAEFHNLKKHPVDNHDNLKKGMSDPYWYRELFIRKIIEICQF